MYFLLSGGRERTSLPSPPPNVWAEPQARAYIPGMRVPTCKRYPVTPWPPWSPVWIAHSASSQGTCLEFTSAGLGSGVSLADEAVTPEPESLHPGQIRGSPLGAHLELCLSSALSRTEAPRACWPSHPECPCLEAHPLLHCPRQVR